MGIDVQVLGPVGVALDGRAVDLGGARQRRLLAVLALRVGQVVDSATIIDAVWADSELPATPRETTRTYVSRLRRALGGAEHLVGRSGGYVLTLGPDAVDAVRFERLVATALAVGLDDGPARCDQLRDALAMWRGPALAGFEHEEWARADAARLDERRAFAIDELAQAEIRLGRHEAVLAELRAAAEAAPLRERTQRLLVEALAHAGRRAEALRTYEAYRRRLATDLGLEPGEELRELDRRIAADLPPGPVAGDGAGKVHSYELHERIGTGAFAVVYRGTQPAIDRPVAVKQIRAELANRPEFIRRFEAEAQLVARLEHPHIVPLYDYWREPGSAYLVMRWLRGGSLEAALAGGPLALGRLLEILTQVGAALTAAHAVGFVHRDLKPANILLDEIGNAYLSDFGIARGVDLAHQPVDALSVGSPAYAPPEQLRREPVDATADVYALAVVAFECLTGRLPFADARDEAELLRHQLGSAFPSMRSSRPELPPALDDVLARASAKRPADRHPSVEAFVGDLRAAADRRADRAAVGGLGTASALPGAEAVNPYKGLLPFDEADAALFHGRERLVASLAERLAGDGTRSRVVALVGPSGSGKSSALRAGLIPALRKGAVPGSDGWYVATMLPGASPFEELCAALRRVAVESHAGLVDEARSGRLGILRAAQRVLGPGRELLLVIDQFEELFTHLTDETERARFLTALGEAVSTVGSPLRVVLTLRADFYDRPLRYPALARLLSESTVVLTPLAPDELEQAVTAPASRAGVHFEPGLVAEIIADVGSQPGALPLLQYALTELFDARADAVLQVETYRAMGGLAGAIAARAEQMFTTAGPGAQLAVRRLMRRLVSPGEGSEDTRRSVRRAELSPDPLTESVLDAFGRARLLSFDRDPGDRSPTVEVAHEALIRQWPRLRQWVDEDRAGLAVHRRLTTAATAWRLAAGDAGELFRGTRLATTEEWVNSNRDECNADELAFFDASVAARDAERTAEQERWQQQLREHHRLQRLFAAAVVVTVLAVVAGAFAVQQRGRATERAAAAAAAAYAAETERIGSDAAQLVDTDRRLALLLASEAYRREPGPATLGALQRVLSHTDELLGYLGGAAASRAVAWAGPQQLVLAHSDGVELVDLAGAVQRRIDVPGANVLAVDPTGSVLAIGTNDAVALVRLDGAAPTRRVPQPAPVQALAFGPDGILAVGDRAGTVTVRDGTTGDVRWTLRAHPEQSLADLEGVQGVVETVPHVAATAARGVLDIAFALEAGLMATGGFGSMRVWDLASGAPVSRTPLAYPLGGQSLIASARTVDFADLDGRPLVVAADQSRAWTVDPGSGEVVHVDEHTVRGAYLFLSTPFAVDVHGRQLVSVLSERTGQLTDLAEPSSARQRITHGLGVVTGVALAPDGRRVALAGEKGAGVFSLVGDGLIAEALPTALPTRNELGITPDGEHLLVSDSTLLHAGLYRRDGTEVPLGIDDAYFVFATPRNDRVIVAARSGFYLVDPGSGRTVVRLDWDASQGGYPSVVAATDELLLVSPLGRLQVFALGDGARRLSVEGLPRVFTYAVGAAPDGTFAYVSDRMATVTRVDLATGAATRIDAGGITTITFTPDPSKLVTSRPDGSLIEREAATLQPTGRRFLAGEGEDGENSAQFSDDGRLMATLSGASVQLWDWQSGVRIGDVFPSDDGWGLHIGGSWATGARDGRPVRWNLEVSAWPAIACRAAGRNLTPEEWQQYGPNGSAYIATCPRFPSLDGGRTAS